MPNGRPLVAPHPDVNLTPRFDGRQIRVDIASDTGPRGGGGPRGGQGGYGRGGYSMPVVGGGHPGPGVGYAPQPYGMPPGAYQQAYGRGYGPVNQAVPAAYGVHPQGT